MTLLEQNTRKLWIELLQLKVKTTVGRTSEREIEE